MLKTLTLIGMMFIGSLFAMDAAASTAADDLDTQLRSAHTRAANATTFETMAMQSVMVNDEDAASGTEERIILNTSLVSSFEQMVAALGVSPLLALHTIGTKDEASEACAYYSGAKNALVTLMRNLTEQLDEAE